MGDFALLLHLFGAFLLVAGTILAGVAFEAARRRESSEEIALLLGLTQIAAMLILLGALLALGFGLWLVHLGHWGYGAGWVDAALALLLTTLVLGGIGGQRPKRARRLASQLATEHTPTTTELRALLDDRTARALNYLSALLLIAIIVLMVFKPGARTHSAADGCQLSLARAHGSSTNTALSLEPVR